MTKKRVIEILSDFSDISSDQITSDTMLVADMGLSSLDVLNVVVAFEDEFKIEIPDEDIEKFIRVGDILLYLEEQIIAIQENTATHIGNSNHA